MATMFLPCLTVAAQAEPIPPTVAYNCNEDSGACKFTPEEDCAIAYYEPARLSDEAFINCTRASTIDPPPL